MKKTILAFLLPVTLCLGLAACGKKDENPAPDTVAPKVAVEVGNSLVNGKVSVSYTVTDDVTPSSELETTVTVMRGETAIPFDAEKKTFTPDTAGEYTVFVSAKDKAGNLGSGQKSATVGEYGTFASETGVFDFGVTTEGSTLTVGEEYKSAQEVVSTGNYFVEGLSASGDFQIDFKVSGLSYEQAEQSTIFPKLFVTFSQAAGEDSVWLEPINKQFGVYNVTAEDAYANGKSGTLNPVPNGEAQTVSILRIGGYFYAIAYNGQLTDVFEKKTEASDLIERVAFRAESMAVTVSDVKLTPITSDKTTPEFDLAADYLNEMTSSEFDRLSAYGADFGKEFDETRSVVLTGGRALFKEEAGRYYFFTAIVSNVRYNQAGLIYASEGNKFYAIYTDGRNGTKGTDDKKDEVTHSQDASVFMDLVINGTSISYPWNGGSREFYTSYDSSKPVKLVVVRDGANFYLFAGNVNATPKLIGVRTVETLAEGSVKLGFGNNEDTSTFTDWEIKEYNSSEELDGITSVDFKNARHALNHTVFDRWNTDDSYVKFDFSKEFDETKPEIVGNGYGRTYFKEKVGKYYYFTATMARTPNLSQSGLIYASADKNISYGWYTDGNNGTNNTPSRAQVFMDIIMHGRDITWPNRGEGSRELKTPYDSSEPVKLVVVRDGADFYLFASNVGTTPKLIGVRTVDELADSDVFIGFGVNSNTTFSAWEIKEYGASAELDDIKDVDFKTARDEHKVEVDSAFDRTSQYGADFSKEFDEAPQVSAAATGYAYAWFKQPAGQYYIYKATVQLANHKQGGLVYATDGNTRYALFTDGNNGTSNDPTKAKVFMSMKFDGTYLTWPYQQKGTYEIYKNYNSSEKLTFTFVRNDTDFYFYLGNDFLGARQILSVKGKDVNLGFGTNGDTITMTDWSISTFATKDELTKAEAIPTSFTIDLATYEASAFERSDNAGADFTHENDASDAKVTISANGFHWAYLKTPGSKFYCYEVTAKNISGNQGGLIYASHNGVHYGLFTDSQNSQNVIMDLKITGTTISFPFQNAGSVEFKNVTYNHDVGENTFRVVRDNTTFYFFVNDTYIGTRVVEDLADVNVKLGFGNNTTATEYSKWKITQYESSEKLDAIEGMTEARKTASEKKKLKEIKTNVRGGTFPLGENRSRYGKFENRRVSAPSICAECVAESERRMGI